MRPSPLLFSIAALTAASCTSAGEQASAPSSCTGTEVLVAASDYSSSAVCAAPGGECRSGPDLGADPQLATGNGRTFFVARDNELVFELDSACGTPIARHSVKVDEKRSANPHDAAAAPDGSLFVVLYNLAKIAVLKDGRVDGTIDLASRSLHSDGNPDAESIRIVDVGGAPKAFVSLEQLSFDPSKNKLVADRPSQMLRIDVATRTIEATIDLAGRNPFNPMSEDGGALFLAEPGNFDDASEELAGIERFDVATSTTRLLVTERELGGSVSEIAVSNGCGAAIVAGPERDVNPTSLVTFDANTGNVSRVLGPTGGYDLQGLAWHGGRLFVGDRRAGASGFSIHVLERQGVGCALRDTEKPLRVEQRPVALRPAR